MDMTKRVIALAATLGFGLHLAAQPATAQQSSSSPRGGEVALNSVSEAVESLAAKVAPCVVKIMVTGYGPVNEAGRMETALIGRQRSIGSGVILDPNGYIVTNAHVVSGAQRVRVAVYRGASGGGNLQSLASGSQPRYYEARIVGIDKTTDLAVLKIDAKDLPVLEVGSYSHLRQGEFVLAFGTPEGLENTVTMGVVSSVLRQLDPDSSAVYIQTDAAINPGNSGGPLVNTAGQLIGINTAIFSESGGNEGIGFAIPSVIVRSVYGQIKEFGHVHRFEVGVKLQTITPTLAEGLRLSQDHGIVIADVDPDGPAASEGVQRQDIVQALNGAPVNSLPQFAASLYLRNPGAKVRLEVLRGEKRMTFEIPVVQQDKDLDNVLSSINPEKALVARLGVLGIELDSKLVAMFPDLRIKSGVAIAAKAAGSAVDTGLETGDVIHAVNTTDIASMEGLRTVIDGLKPGEPVVLTIERGDTLRYLAFDWE